MKKRGQVWVETVIYTLIGLTIIGVLISIASPKINQMKDKAILGQVVDSLNELNSKIMETLVSPANSRQVTLGVQKGEYVIDSINNSIYYVLRGTGYLYSEPGELVSQGDIYVKTISRNNKYDVYLSLNYSSYNITYAGKDTNKILTPASAAYTLLIQNQGNKKLNIEMLN